MNEDPFTNREIKAMFEHISKELTNIGKEVKFTNGKVKDLIAWRQQLTGAGTVIKGLWAFAGVFAVAIIFAVFNMYLELRDIDTKVQASVQAELSTYEFEVTK